MPSTIAELLAETESLSTLNAAVKAVPDVLAALEDPTQTLTVFAPNDDAFSPFAPELVEIIEGIADGSTLMGDDGVACWDINGDSIPDDAEDLNKDGEWDALDCRAHCWDLNGNGLPDEQLEDENDDLNPETRVTVAPQLLNDRVVVKPCFCQWCPTLPLPQKQSR